VPNGTRNHLSPSSVLGQRQAATKIFRPPDEMFFPKCLIKVGKIQSKGWADEWILPASLLASASFLQTSDEGIFMKHIFPESSDDKTITCPSCQALNETHAEFCHECGYAFGFATLDPAFTIRKQGSFLKKAVERPSKTALAVIWIIHLPLLVLCIGAAINLFLNRTGLEDFVFFWAMIVCACAAIVILYRTTNNYLKRRSKAVVNKHKYMK
jgi:hypothetical protein